MRKNSITRALRVILTKDLGKTIDFVFSDNYGFPTQTERNYLIKTTGKRVGVKFSKVWLDDKEKEVVKSKMEEKGFIYHFINENNNCNSRCYGTLYNGTRFCFEYND